MTERFLYNSGDEFPILDLLARLAFKTDSSISFMLGQLGDTLNFADGESFEVGPGGVFKEIGGLDVHYPCEGHIKVQLRVVLPTKYHACDQMCKLVEEIFFAL